MNLEAGSKKNWEHKHPLKVMIAQLRSTLGELSENAKRAIKAVKYAEQNNIDLLIFPELFISGYYSRDWFLSPLLFEKEQEWLNRVFSYADNTTIIIGSMLESGKKRKYNGATVFSPLGFKEGIPKHYLPYDNVFYEARFFETPEDKYKPSLNLYDWNIAVAICEDMWRESKVLASHFSSSPDLLVIINASPFTENKFKERLELTRSHATFMNSYVVYANIWGGQEEVIFDGQSFILSPNGTLLIKAKPFKSEYLTIELPINKSANSLNNNSSSIYRTDPDEILFHALRVSLQSYLRETPFDKVVVGLSGGIDSALVATIATLSIGPKRVKAVFMPSRYTSKLSYEGVNKLVKNLGIDLDVIDIEPILKTVAITLNASENDGIAFQNLQSRIRGMVLMYYANKYHALVLNTGNKSELAVGYMTLYGDAIGAWSILGDIFKTRVYDLARYVNRIKPGIIPEIIINRPPSAELANNQKDEDDLMPYYKLDHYLQEVIPFDKIVGPEDKEKLWVRRKLVQNEFKRRQIPPLPTISRANLGVGRMSPMSIKYLQELFEEIKE